jgi:hypothetical protein
MGTPLHRCARRDHTNDQGIYESKFFFPGLVSNHRHLELEKRPPEYIQSRCRFRRRRRRVSNNILLDRRLRKGVVVWNFHFDGKSPAQDMVVLFMTLSFLFWFERGGIPLPSFVRILGYNAYLDMI